MEIEKMKEHQIEFVDCEKGQYGQWIVTFEVDDCFYHRQMYGYSKKNATKIAKRDLLEAIKTEDTLTITFN